MSNLRYMEFSTMPTIVYASYEPGMLFLTGVINASRQLTPHSHSLTPLQWDEGESRGKEEKEKERGKKVKLLVGQKRE